MTEKKTIQDFWTRNVPGLDVVCKKYNPGQKEFYIEADKLRYKYDGYIPGLIDSFAEAGKSVLEVGCGLGSDSRYISGKGASLTSLDLSFNNVSMTKKGVSLLGLKNRGVCADAERLPFKDSSFDAVYSFGVLHHTPKTGEAIGELLRVLKPGGRCVVMLYRKGYAYYYLILRHGWKILFKGYDKEKVMSEYDHTPLSKLYSNSQIRNLFRQFKDTQLEVTTYGGMQAHPFLKYVYRLLHSNAFLLKKLGSYIIIKARK